jgi:hypothetical protein
MQCNANAMGEEKQKEYKNSLRTLYPRGIYITSTAPNRDQNQAQKRKTSTKPPKKIYVQDARLCLVYNHSQGRSIMFKILSTRSALDASPQSAERPTETPPSPAGPDFLLCAPPIERLAQHAFWICDAER